eukprot:scaffold100300_cov23-Cyclotella_meneghiniana.AAC.1
MVWQTLYALMTSIPSSRAPRNVIQQNRPSGSEPCSRTLPLVLLWSVSSVPPAWKLLSSYLLGAEEK